MLGIGERDTDAERLDAVHEHDVAGLRFIGDDAVEALEHEHLVHFRGYGRSIAVQHDDLLAGTQAAAIDAPDADPADIARIIERADLQLQRTVGVVGANRDVRENRFE